MSMTGRCLCGAVTYMVTEIHRTECCHCAMCRRWSGGPAFGADAGGVAWQGEASISRYRSSDWAERGFCKHCGTNLFYRLLDGRMLSLNPFTLDDTSGLTFDTQIFIDEKPPLYDFANDTPTMTGAEVIAAFADGQD